MAIRPDGNTAIVIRSNLNLLDAVAAPHTNVCFDALQHSHKSGNGGCGGYKKYMLHESFIFQNALQHEARSEKEETLLPG
jgi:hypothetical protein